jgi:hypothetical protein
VPLTLPAPSSATVATTTGAATAAGKTRGARRGRHRTGKDAYSFLWLPPQSGFFPLRLHVQKNALPFFSALYSIGSKVVTLCDSSQNGWCLERPHAHHQ